MNKRRIISWIIVLGLMLSSFTMTFAAVDNNQDSNTKAKSLNKLDLVTGDGKGNYNLSSSLTRGEAVTFIVKLMGKSKYVNDNKEEFSNTTFSDVKVTDWYAPFIGFCKVNGIVSGVSEKKFGPKSNITEKAFLTMVMKVLGYINDDFTWATVYQKAYEIGLVTDEAYKNKSEDNKKYIRADVVNVMYNALGLKIKDSETLLIKKLIADGQITPQMVYDAGLTYDQLPTAISQITVQSSEWIKVKLNEAVNTFKDSDISIYDNSTKEILPTKIVSQTDDEIKIKTNTQKLRNDYGIRLSNIIDKDNNYIKEIKSSFIGFENTEKKSDMFQISKIEQKSNNEVEVYFTHPININAEQPDYYSVQQSGTTVLEGSKNNLSVKVSEDSANAVIMNTKDFVFQPDNEYTIKIKGALVSAYGTNLGLEAGDQMLFIAKSMESQQFKLVGITALNNKSIQLDFNKQVYQTTAEQVFSYYITEVNTGTPIQIMKATVSNNLYGKSCAIILTIAGTFDSKKGYNLLINNVSDSTKQIKIEDQKFTFNTIDQANTDNKITSVLPIDLNSISVSFEKKIDAESAEDVTNYSILCLNNTAYNISPIKAIYSSDAPYSVKLYFVYNKPMTSGYQYKIRVSNLLQDYTGATMSVPLEYSYIANNIVKIKPEITKAAFIAKDTVKVTFSKDIALDAPNILTQNFYIQVINDENNKKVPIAINYIDRNTIVLKFNSIDFNNQYYFKFLELKDITGETYSGTQVNTAIVSGE